MRKIILSLVLLITAGCSAMESLQKANTQNILIETPNVEGAECALSDKEGRKWNLWETPGAVAIQEGHPPLVIICNKKGFKKSVLTINEHKEEILTIDGKHIDISIYNQFPTKFPRLIPGAIKEAAGFVQDPTGSISTTYPNKVMVWMEPKKWESEEQMREWAFDREIYNRSEYIAEEEAKLTDDERKAKRRTEKKAREKARKEFVEKAKDNLNPVPYIKKGFKNTTKILNPMPAIEKASEKGVGSVVDPVPVIKKGANSINPYNAVDFLNKRNKVRQENFNKLNGNEHPTKKDTYTIDALPDEIPADRNQDGSNEPQDLFEEQNSKAQQRNHKIEYDENGYRILPSEIENKDH